METAAPIRVMLVEDNPGDARLLRESLLEASHLQVSLTHLDCLTPALARLAEERFDVVLLDLSLPESRGFDTFLRVREAAGHTPVVVLSGMQDDELSLRAVKEGAQDYLVKGQASPALLARAVHYAIERQAMLAQLHQRTWELQVREADFRNVIATNADAMVIVDEGGRIRFANPAAEGLFGMKHLIEAVFPFPLREGELVEVEVKRLGEGGRSAEMRVVGAEWEGRPAHLATLRDTTERKHLEQQLQQSQKMEAIGQLAGGVAHDVNNTLMAITGYAEMLLRGLPATSPLQQEVLGILKAAEGSAALTRQLLAFSRRQILEPRVLELGEVLTEMEPLLRRLLREDIELVMSPGPEAGRVEADPTQMQQVVMNLVINARDAMPEGGRITIATRACTGAPSSVAGAAEARDYVVLSVSDTGEGMDDETRSHIFEPFFTTKADWGGTGLGLSTVYGIVTQSGGQIEVQSSPSGGTSFQIWLPQVTDAVSDSSGEPVGPGLADAQGERLLLVDDNSLVREALADMLRAGGYTVLEAPDGHAALQVAQGEVPDLVVTDIVMPGMSGRDLARLLRERHPRLRVLFVSGYADQALPVGEELGAGAGFLAKPASMESLLRKVRELLDAAPVPGRA
jgi:signal transduction histidine kinase